MISDAAIPMIDATCSGAISSSLSRRLSEHSSTSVRIRSTHRVLLIATVRDLPSDQQRHRDPRLSRDRERVDAPHGLPLSAAQDRPTRAAYAVRQRLQRARASGEPALELSRSPEYRARTADSETAGTTTVETVDSGEMCHDR